MGKQRRERWEIESDRVRERERERVKYAVDTNGVMSNWPNNDIRGSPMEAGLRRALAHLRGERLLYLYHTTARI